MSNYLDELARFAAETRGATLPASTTEAAKLVLLDTLGAILAGSAQPENAKLARFAAGRVPHGQATLLGHGAQSEAGWAALTNATAGVALEVDEGNRLGGGHPAIHTLPGALAVAEERGLDGRGLLDALVAGYEVGSRIGTATTVRDNVHSHGTWGTISTAVAIARLAGASAPTIRQIINLAASMSPANTWTPALRGATIRNLYPGRSAWTGVLAVELQRCGFTALEDGPADVYGTILGEAFDPAEAVRGLDAVGHGEPHRIEGNYFKLHACCRYTHFALDAVLALRAQHAVTAEEVTQVQVLTIPFGLRMADGEPTTMLGAKFSIPYVVAAALVLGHADLSAFQGPALEDPRIRALAQRVEVSADTQMSPRRVDGPTAHVRIVLRDGRTFAATCQAARGDAANPAPPAEVEAKFLALAGPVVGDGQARLALDAVRGIDTLKNVRDLTSLIAG